MKRVRILLLCACAGLVGGCAPRVDQSGWEIARKKNPAERLESFPEIPVVLPGSPLPPEATATGSAIEGVVNKSLDLGSLFRRGFSAPSP